MRIIRLCNIYYLFLVEIDLTQLQRLCKINIWIKMAGK